MRKMVLFLCLALLLGAPARAAELKDVTDALPPVAREILGAAVSDALPDGAKLLERIWEHIRASLGTQLAQAAQSASVAAAVTLLCSLAGALSPGDKTPEWVCLGAALAVAGCCFGRVGGYLTQAREALCALVDFSRALLPCVAAASAAAGHAASGAARYAASCLFMDVLLTIGTGVILPLIYAYVAAATAKAALPSGALGGPVSLVKWLCTTALTLLCTAFTFYLTITGAVSGKADAVAAELTKTAVSTALPVVGRILSDAASTYLAGAELVRGAVGVVGLAAVLCVCVGPALSLGAHYLLFKAASAVTEPFSEGRLSALLGDIGTAYGMALGLVGSGGAMLFLSVVLSTEALAG